MVLGEVLGKFVTSEVVTRDDARHCAGLFENTEAAVHAGLGQAGIAFKDLAHRQRAVATLEYANDTSSTTGVALIRTTQQVGYFDINIDVSSMRGHSPQRIRNENG